MTEPKPNLSAIDSSFSHLPEFSKLTLGTTRAIQGMRNSVIHSEGALSAKSKLLLAIVWSICARCEPCVKYYAAQASSIGVTTEELGEACAVASTMGGCVGETWALKAFAAFCSSGATDDAGDCAC